jgi:hypothetical protein
LHSIRASLILSNAIETKRSMKSGRLTDPVFPETCRDPGPGLHQRPLTNFRIISHWIISHPVCFRLFRKIFSALLSIGFTLKSFLSFKSVSFAGAPQLRWFRPKGFASLHYLSIYQRVQSTMTWKAAEASSFRRMVC